MCDLHCPAVRKRRFPLTSDPLFHSATPLTRTLHFKTVPSVSQCFVLFHGAANDKLTATNAHLAALCESGMTTAHVDEVRGFLLVHILKGCSGDLHWIHWT